MLCYSLSLALSEKMISSYQICDSGKANSEESNESSFVRCTTFIVDYCQVVSEVYSSF